MSCNQKNKCGTIIISPQGPNGQPGSQIFTDIGPPPPALGVNGDLYINTTNGDYYQKLGGVWVLRGNLQGPPGSQIFTGNGVPPPALGADGDFYLDNFTGNYYTKVAGVWTLQGNLEGPPGPPGPPGAQGEPGSQIFTDDGVPPPALGADGDFYLDNLTGDYYTKVGGVWILEGNLEGPPGPQGEPGSQIFTGDGVPPPALGADGDFYLDNLTGDYYTKVGGVWTLQGNLRGPSGLSPSIFGSGRDGDVVIAAPTTLLRDMVYNNLTVNAGASLDTGGYRIFVRNMLINNGTIQNDGTPGTNVGGIATPLGTLGVGAAGGNPGTVGSPSTNIPSLILGTSAGNKGGGLSGGGPVSRTTSLNGNDIPLNNLIEIVKVRSLDNLRYNGGSGGGGGQGAGGGGGGGGGGVVAIFANVIVNNGTISAVGGNGGPSSNGTDGGGGGGGGGLLVYATTSITGNIPTIANVAGGLGGVGGTLGDGSPGFAGSVYGLIV
ncbi:Collagen-like protein [Orpheovirus IHUMI-LCC2]|uniref:Collagen-like protein n=1 Tax=Orpheovirus IHUMI-LCC2 TaxID=2023057 RepID=A0A2I2L380_9VIRU|nr:Collagen-like protein [Orpheovirus IHUMI-LCC2]SNW61986.1 Collagen-like protein [Orpheovirus IHUMI-LCC2]